MLPVDQISDECRSSEEFQPINLLTRNRSKKSLLLKIEVLNYTHSSASDKYIVLTGNKISEGHGICLKKTSKSDSHLFSLLNLLIADQWLRLIDLNSHSVAFLIRATDFKKERFKTGT